MQAPMDLYHAVLARRSVRRYDREPLDQRTVAKVTEIISNVRPLLPENQFHAVLRDVPPGADLVALVGGYGRVVNPPHFLVPYVLGQEHLLTDVGYRAEQISVRLAVLGIGSCFIGALAHEKQVRTLYELPKEARIVAFLVYGWPSQAVGGRLANRVMRVVAGASRKLSATEIFFESSFDHPAPPPQSVAPLIEAARHAPSAVNAQPWRFLRVDERLYLFVTRNNRRYGPGIREQYCFHDGGAAMANVTLAADALGRDGRWVPLEGTEPFLPEHPSNLHPLATLILGDRD